MITLHTTYMNTIIKATMDCACYEKRANRRMRDVDAMRMTTKRAFNTTYTNTIEKTMVDCHENIVPRFGRDFDSMRMLGQSSKGKHPRARKPNDHFLETCSMTSTAPIPCAPPSRGELSNLELEKELQDMYKTATWQMHHRIQSSRRRNNVGIGKSVSHVKIVHRSAVYRSHFSQENSRAKNYSNGISQFNNDYDHDQPLAFDNFEM